MATRRVCATLLILVVLTPALASAQSATPVPEPAPPLVQHNVLAMSGLAVEAAGDVDTLLLDKAGTITLVNRQATEFIPVAGVVESDLADAAQLASAILSAVIFNAVIIVSLIPLALRGIAYRPLGAAAILRRNMLVYGLGGVILPFVGIKFIDLLVTALKLA